MNMKKKTEMTSNSKYKEIPGGVAAVKGIRATGVACGLKPDGALDLALFHSDAPCRTAAFFTTNKLLGAHIPVMREKLRASGGLCRALLVNSKNANCATGAAGEAANRKIAGRLAPLLSVPADQILFASTGVIGVQLPIDRIAGALPMAVGALSSSGGDVAARAIMTTDTKPKSFCIEVKDGKSAYRIAGVAKGAGMICPNMATMFVFVFTDADVPRRMLDGVCRDVLADTLNSISVDGDMSPCDTLLVMANGRSGVSVKPGTPGALRFRDALRHVCDRISMEIIRDGEGATKLVDIRVAGAKNGKDARTIARAIAHSQLVKTAIFGEDPNWGRIVSAAGASGADFDPALATLSVGKTVVYRRGRIGRVNQDIMKGDTIVIRLDAGLGDGASRFYTCDLSTEYVKINAEYTT